MNLVPHWMSKRLALLLGLCFFQSCLSHADSEQRRLSTITWNVWFDQKTGGERYPNILRELKAHSPEIIFLQEVTPAFIKLANQQLRGSSFYFTPSKDARRRYGQAFITNTPLLMLKEYSLDSQYGRDAVIGAYPLKDDHALILINVHLESGLFESKMRAHQVDQITNVFEKEFREVLKAEYPELTTLSVVWAGDFNLGYSEFSEGIGGFVDSAKVFSDNTPTYHVDNNYLANATAGWFEDSARLDRVLVRSDTLTPTSYEVKNNEYYAQYSDHYPVVVELSVSQPITANK